MQEDKGLVRTRARTARSLLSLEERSSGSRLIAHHALGMWDLDRVATVLAYMATPEEVDPGPIVEVLRMRGIRIAIPRVNAPVGLSLHLFTPETPLEIGPFGIAEPAAESPGVEPGAIDAALVPGVAFDPSGGRVGYGGGYYDRLLPLLRGDIPRIGLAFDEQVFPEVPADDHDVPMSVVVTPTRILRPER